MLRIIVTGGTGFIGLYFIEAMQAAGHEVAVLSREERADDREGIRWLRGSLSDPPWEEIKRFAPTTCAHLAWLTTPGVYLESQENLWWLEWSANFIAGLVNLGVGHIMAIGTCIEYEITGHRLAETSSAIAPTSLYAKCKHELHLRLRRELALAGVSLTWARIFYPYGAREHPLRLASSVIDKLRAGDIVTLQTPDSVKDYIHASDIASALLMLVESPFDGAINLGTGEGVSVEAVSRLIARLLERPALIRRAERCRTDPFDFVVADATKLRSLGWRPSTTLENGLRLLIETLSR